MSRSYKDLLASFRRLEASYRALLAEHLELLRDQAKLAREFRQAQAKLEQGWDFLRKLQQLHQAQHAERDDAAPLQ